MPNPEGARTRGLTNHLTHARYSSGAKGPDRIGGVLLGLSSGSILQSAPSTGGSGEEALFKEPVPPSNRTLGDSNDVLSKNGFVWVESLAR